MKFPWTKPPNVVSSGRMGTWMNWVEHMFQALSPIDTPTVSADWSAKGLRLNSAAGGGAGTTVQLCVITELFGTYEDEAFDYIGVTPFNSTGMTLSGSQFICAKAVTARGPASELIPIGNGYGPQEIAYSQYYGDISRFALNSTTGASEYDSIHPRYVVWPGSVADIPVGGDITQYYVWVTRTSNPTGVLDASGSPIYYLETNNRVWAFDASLSGS